MFGLNKNLAQVAVVGICIGVLTLVGCGGGSSSGGGPPGGGSFLSLIAGWNPGTASFDSPVLIGSWTAGVTTGQTYPVAPINWIPGSPPPVASVPPPSFPASGGTSTDYIEIRFGTTVMGPTILAGNGGSGIVLRDQTTLLTVPFALDVAGVFDPTNAWDGNKAPATLRLYASADGTLPNPAVGFQFPAGNYILAITDNLRGWNGTAAGTPLCTGSTSPNCSHSVTPTYPFTIGPGTPALAPDPNQPSVPISGLQGVNIASEITLRFARAVNFASLVGPTNLTSLDPFISLPRSLAYVADCNAGGAPIPPFANIGNLFLNYRVPVDALGTSFPLPTTLGFVVYMPDPILNPTEVRIRFTNVLNAQGQTLLQGVENPALSQYQNYSSETLRFQIMSNDPARAGTMLSLPGITPVPGSLAGSTLQFADTKTAVVDVLVMSTNFMYQSPPLPTIPAQGNPCYGSTNNGTSARNGTPLQSDFWLRFSWAVGPTLAQNPQPPDATFGGTQTGNLRGIFALNTAGMPADIVQGLANTAVPAVYYGGVGFAIQRSPTLAPNRLANTSVLGTPLDIEIGHFINNLNFLNNITNPGRASLIAGVPDGGLFGTFPIGMLDILGVTTPPSPPSYPYGNYLYVVDGDQGVVKVFNGYEFSFISLINGIPSPSGLGISPNLQYLYIASEFSDIVSQVYANPQSPNFHTFANQVVVGNGPTTVSVQPANEDIFVANWGDNTVSIIDSSSFSVRYTFSTDPGPSDVFVTNRMLGMGLTNAYLAFVPCFYGNSVVVYESDSGAVPENGNTGKVVAIQGGFQAPRRGGWNWRTYIGLSTQPGAFIPETLSTKVKQFTMYNFVLAPPPGFPGPPPQRNFNVLSEFDGAVAGQNTAAPSDCSVDSFTGLYNVNVVGITNNKGVIDPATGGGAPTVVLVSYPATGVVVAWDYNGTAPYGSVSAPGCDFLQGYYDQ